MFFQGIYIYEVVQVNVFYLNHHRNKFYFFYFKEAKLMLKLNTYCIEFNVTETFTAFFGTLINYLKFSKGCAVFAVILNNKCMVIQYISFTCC